MGLCDSKEVEVPPPRQGTTELPTRKATRKNKDTNNTAPVPAGLRTENKDAADQLKSKKTTEFKEDGPSQVSNPHDPTTPTDESSRWEEEDRENHFERSPPPTASTTSPQDSPRGLSKDPRKYTYGSVAEQQRLAGMRFTDGIGPDSDGPQF